MFKRTEHSVTIEVLLVIETAILACIESTFGAKSPRQQKRFQVRDDIKVVAKNKVAINYRLLTLSLHPIYKKMKNSLSPEWNILAPITFYISFHNRFLHSLLRSTFSLSLSMTSRSCLLNHRSLSLRLSRIHRLSLPSSSSSSLVYSSSSRLDCTIVKVLFLRSQCYFSLYRFVIILRERELCFIIHSLFNYFILLCFAVTIIRYSTIQLMCSTKCFYRCLR